MAEISAEDLNEARQVFAIIKQMMDSNGYHYEADEEKLRITAQFKGEDLPMRFSFVVIARMKIVSLLSNMPFNFAKDKIDQAALACSKINYAISYGDFDLDITDGNILFRTSTSYRDSMLSPSVFDFMLSIGASTVDDYNDKFMALSSGLIDLDKFYEIVDKI